MTNSHVVLIMCSSIFIRRRSLWSSHFSPIQTGTVFFFFALCNRDEGGTGGKGDFGGPPYDFKTAHDTSIKITSGHNLIDTMA